MFCKKRSATLLLARGTSIAKFLRSLILKNICEWLLLKIRISVTNSEAVVQRISVKKLFLEVSQNSQRSKVTDLRLWHRCFPVNFVKFLRTPFFIPRTPLVAASANFGKGGNFYFFYPFKPFSILNFAAAE